MRQVWISRRGGPEVLETPPAGRELRARVVTMGELGLTVLVDVAGTPGPIAAPAPLRAIDAEELARHVEASRLATRSPTARPWPTSCAAHPSWPATSGSSRSICHASSWRRAATAWWWPTRAPRFAADRWHGRCSLARCMHRSSHNSPHKREYLVLWPEASAAMTLRTAIRAIRRALLRLVRPLILAAVAITVLAGLFAPRDHYICTGPSKQEEARWLTSRLAHEGHARWSMVNPGKSHPSHLGELMRYADMIEPVDPWGHRLLMLRPGEGPADWIGIVSMGPDGKLGTGDDIHSWDEARAVE
ncbi:MAG TPA: type II secretion system protein GspG [Kofleriaceae bacterium]|nr:type II secretion system protein GspG [Kofleriaceae bacterium]